MWGRMCCFILFRWAEDPKREEGLKRICLEYFSSLKCFHRVSGYFPSGSVV